jgi:hypothetical protein
MIRNIDNLRRRHLSCLLLRVRVLLPCVLVPSSIRGGTSLSATARSLICFRSFVCFLCHSFSNNCDKHLPLIVLSCLLFVASIDNFCDTIMFFLHIALPVRVRFYFACVPKHITFSVLHWWLTEIRLIVICLCKETKTVVPFVARHT